MENSMNLVSDVALAIFRANGALVAWGDRFVSGDGLTSARWQVLGALALASDDQTSPQLAMAMGVSRQAMHKQLALLLEDELVEKLENPLSLKSPKYHLTKLGEEAFQRVNTRWLAHAKKVLSAVSEQDLQAAIGLLRKIEEIHSVGLEDFV